MSRELSPTADARTLTYLKTVPVTRVSGIGEVRAKALSEIDPPVESVYDLITYYPRRHIDRTNQVAIRDVAVGEEAMILATVKRVSGRRTRNGRSLVEADVFDGTSYMRCVFFNQPWRQKQLLVGREAVFFGKVDRYQGRRQMTNPVVDLVGDRTGRIVPVYPQSEKAGLTTWEVAAWVDEALRRIPAIVDPLDEAFAEKHQLIGRDRAIRQIHSPDGWHDFQQARRRLCLDELLRLQLILVSRKRALERQLKGIRHNVGGPLVASFHRRLPFSLTEAQRRAIAEIDADLAGPHPMHRLLQGDVGSGKTVVAVSALLAAVDGTYQGALMAPTEVLAEQHHLSVREMLSGLTVPDDGKTLFGERPLRVELLTNRTSAADRARILPALAAGEVDIVIGTHAILTEHVEFRRLGIAVIDEQHRFGVEQRAALRGKGDAPDVLVMTATPIPRTAAMTVYGDLDVTTIDELPPGRTPIETVWLQGPLQEQVAWDAVGQAVAAGQQAYVVCPLIEESDKIEARSAEEEHARLSSGVLSGIELGLLHGRMASREKEEVMERFRSGRVGVLVSTTVIEVGVDVPNATVMVIEDAGRFGIAQLHQLRGRVGRGSVPSACYLLTEGGETDTPETTARLEAMVRTTNGFELAEVDLDLRGEGTILGTRQKGRSDLKLASLRRDKELVAEARQLAFELLDADPALSRHPELREEVEELVDGEEREFLFKS